MAITDSARAYYEKMFPGKAGTLAQTDPEFAELLCNFACDEVVNQDDLDDRTRLLAILAALLGCQGLDAFRAMVPAALHCGVTPVEIKETVYQATAYLGIGRQSDAGGYLRRGHARLSGLRPGGKPPYQPLAGGQLLRRLLHPHRPGSQAARDDHLLLSRGTGRLRAAAHEPRGR